MNSNGHEVQDKVEPDAPKANLMRGPRLSLAFRKVYVLCGLGFTVEEAAAILGISPAAVRIRLERVRRVMVQLAGRNFRSQILSQTAT